MQHQPRQKKRLSLKKSSLLDHDPGYSTQTVSLLGINFGTWFGFEAHSAQIVWQEWALQIFGPGTAGRGVLWHATVAHALAQAWLYKTDSLSRLCENLPVRCIINKSTMVHIGTKRLQISQESNKVAVMFSKGRDVITGGFSAQTVWGQASGGGGTTIWVQYKITRPDVSEPLFLGLSFPLLLSSYL